MFVEKTENNFGDFKVLHFLRLVDTMWFVSYNYFVILSMLKPKRNLNSRNDLCEYKRIGQTNSTTSSHCFRNQQIPHQFHLRHYSTYDHHIFFESHSLCLNQSSQLLSWPKNKGQKFKDFHLLFETFQSSFCEPVIVVLAAMSEPILSQSWPFLLVIAVTTPVFWIKTCLLLPENNKQRDG